MKHLDIKRALDTKGLTIKELAGRLGVTYNGALPFSCKCTNFGIS